MNVNEVMDNFFKHCTAYHEAGHAVAGYVLSGIAPIEIVIKCDSNEAPSTGYRWYGHATSFPALDGWQDAIVGLAGGLAALMHRSDFGRPIKPSAFELSVSDLNSIARVFNRDSLTIKQWRRITASKRNAEIFTKLIDETAELLLRNWPTVEVLANHLVENHEVTGWDFLRLVLAPKVDCVE